MKKIIAGTVLCVAISIAISSLYPLCIEKDTLSTLYTVSGIMFSIGMSLTVISNTSGIKNKDVRIEIRREIKRVRNNFIYCFSIATLLYILFISSTTESGLLEMSYSLLVDSIRFKSSSMLAVYLVYSIIYFIINFIAIQNFNESIEEELNKEDSL